MATSVMSYAIWRTVDAGCCIPTQGRIEKINNSGAKKKIEGQAYCNFKKCLKFFKCY